MKPTIARIRPIAALVAIAALAAGANSAAAAVGAWSDGLKARARLLAAGVEDGRLAAGIEIVLPPGWKTYWRNPGDAGIPPTLDFAASRNLAQPEIGYPVPHRYDDGFSVTNVYTDRVVLTVDAAVLDETADVDLRVTVDLGVCEEICIPDSVTARLVVPAGEHDPAAASILATVLTHLPGPPEPDVFFVDDVSRAGGTDKRPVFRFAVVAPDAREADVFVEGPDDWYAGVPKFRSGDGGQAAFDVEFDRLGAKTPIDGASFRVTVVSGDRAIEQSLGLDESDEID